MPRSKFPTSLRLNAAAQFRALYHRGERKRRGAITLLAAPNQLPHSRLGIVIAKRFVPTAVRRNRLKRIVRESFRQKQYDLVGLDLVVICRDGYEQRDSEFKQCLEKLW